MAPSLFRSARIPLIIFAITIVAFSPALLNGFVEWDDHRNLVKNPHYRGLGWPQLRWMFTTTLMGHYIPLTWMTFGLDYLLWGMNPLGYHLTSLLLHATNASLFYLLALRLLRQALTGTGEPTLRLAAGTAALFFALHPLRVESVAWATERRDVLSGLFFLLTILLYLRASEAERGRRLLTGSVGCYALALASKSVVMTLPLVLILLDLYPLRRLGPWRQWTFPAARRIWAEKLPYLLLALVGAAIALYAVRPVLTPLDGFRFPARVALAFHSLWFYLWKTLLPVDLSPLYQLPAQVSLLDPSFLLSAIAVGTITVGLLLMRRSWPAGLAIWIYYAITLAPVSGLVHAGPQLAADRYSYLSCLGWALLVGGGVCAMVRAHAAGTLGPSFARLAAGAITLWFLGLGALTWLQTQVWRDSETLWRYAVATDSTCSLCYYGLAYELNWYKVANVVNEQGTQEAVAHFRKLEAVERFKRLREQHPEDSDVLNNLGVALIDLGKPTEAIEHFRRAVRLNSAHFEARTNLGAALVSLGSPAEAVEHLRRAIDLNPDAATPRFHLARAYLALGKTGLAQAEYEALKRSNHGLASQLAPLLGR